MYTFYSKEIFLDNTLRKNKDRRSNKTIRIRQSSSQDFKGFRRIQTTLIIEPKPRDSIS